MLSKKIFTKWFIAKTIIFIVLAVLANMFVQSFGAMVTNDIAVQQMNDTDYSYIIMNIYNQIKNNGWVFTLMGLFIFYLSDVIKLASLVKESEGE